jgi:hypothetical protein
MRTRRTFFPCALAAAAGLSAAAAVMAAEADLPQSCTTPSGWNVAVTQGPCATTQTSSTGALTCSPTGTNTGIEYSVTGPGITPDHVFSFVHVSQAGDVLFVGGGLEGAIYPLCVGDPLSGVGLYACHEQGIRLNAEQGKANQFKVIVKGQRDPIASSVVVKKGKTTDSCKIKGLGLQTSGSDGSVACVSSCGNFNPDQTIKRFETVQFKGCAATFEYDTTTGAVVNAFADHDLDEPGANCSDLTLSNVGDLELSLLGTPIGGGKGKFGDGYLSTGNTSCTTRIIGGKVYTWGTAPCP